MSAVVALLLTGCLSRAPVEDDTGAVPAVEIGSAPRILDAGKACDVDESLWTFAATTDAWTEGGWVFLTVDGVYVEQHRVPSVAASRDGSADELLLEMPIAVDWRDDEGTAFACASNPSGQWSVLGLDGETSDCRFWGDPLAFEEVEGAVPKCTTPL